MNKNEYNTNSGAKLIKNANGRFNHIRESY